MSTDPQPLFLLGAGFNADAKAESGAIDGVAYPLAGDLARLCFGLSSLPDVKSVEDLFDDAHERDNWEPMRRLADCLMKADYDLLERLLPYFGAKRNCYSTFFERFAGSQYLTFNYDSLPELFLLRQNQWSPHDGYGVPVDCDIYPTDAQVEDRSSTSLVLHLHGSLCLYASPFTFEEAPGENVAVLKEREQPKYRFDPDAIGKLFYPYQRVSPNHDWDLPPSRVIAPVPDKTEGLKKEFITEVYERAEEVLRSSALPVVAIGYSFNCHDRASYKPDPYFPRVRECFGASHFSRCRTYRRKAFPRVPPNQVRAAQAHAQVMGRGRLPRPPVSSSDDSAFPNPGQTAAFPGCPS